MSTTKINTSPNYRAEPTKSVFGELTVPGDKSISHRALMLASLANDVCDISGFLPSSDCLATMKALQAMGVSIKMLSPEKLRVHGVGMHGLLPPKQALDLGNAGTAMRLLTGLLAGCGIDAKLIGDESLSKRPMRRVTEPLIAMGAQIETSAMGTPPVLIKPHAGLKPLSYQMPIASAQVKSALLLAAMYAQGESMIAQPAITRDHTERMLTAFNYPIETSGNQIRIEGGGELHAKDIIVPGDLSSAAFFIVAAAIAKQPGTLTIHHVGVNPTRTGIITILQAMGADITIVPKSNMTNEPIADIIVRNSELHGINIPADLVPLAIDEFPILFIAAANAQGKTVIQEAKELRVKESDRIAAMVTGLQQLGINASAQGDGAVIHGGKLQGGKVSSYGDHRIAMSFAIASIAASDTIVIDDCRNVMTSFPNFVELANTIGLDIEEEDA